MVLLIAHLNIDACPDLEIRLLPNVLQGVIQAFMVLLLVYLIRLLRHSETKRR